MYASPKPPPDTPFQHGDYCKTRDAEPEWFMNGEHRWQRTCSCGSEYRQIPSGRIESASAAAEPAKSAHEHAPEREGLTTVEFSQPDRCWRSHCMLCTITGLYWYQPDRLETGADVSCTRCAGPGTCGSTTSWPISRYWPRWTA
jgi:hypothetical protein